MLQVNATQPNHPNIHKQICIRLEINTNAIPLRWLRRAKKNNLLFYNILQTMLIFGSRELSSQQLTRGHRPFSQGRHLLAPTPTWRPCLSSSPSHQPTNHRRRGRWINIIYRKIPTPTEWQFRARKLTIALRFRTELSTSFTSDNFYHEYSC